MILRLTNTGIVLLLLLSVTIVCECQKAPEDRVVLVRGDELLIAKADGSHVKVLVKDGARKEEPRWSPDKGRIVYRVDADGNPTTTHARLLVISANGTPEKDVPVWAIEPDGTVVGGLRFVEESGWHSNTSVYASGSVNPNLAEYRIIDVQTGRVTTSYFGTSFATCPAKAQVAYVTETRNASGQVKTQVEINGNPVYASSNDQNLPIQSLQWSADCDRLAFTDSNDRAAFVVLRGGTVEASISLPQTPESLTITKIDDSFLLQSSAGAAFYDGSTRSLRSAPALVEKANEIRLEHERVLKKLGSSQADW